MAGRGGGGRTRKPKPTTKPKRQSKQNPSSNSRSLFVQAGLRLLSDFDSPRTPATPFVRHRGNKEEKGQSRSGSGSGRGSVSRSMNSRGGGAVGRNGFRYDYSDADFQGMSMKESYGGSGKDLEFPLGEAAALVDINEDTVMATPDQKPSENGLKVQYCYHYSSDFVLGDSSHHGLGFSSEPEGNLDEEYQLHQGLGFADVPEIKQGNVVSLSNNMEEDCQITWKRMWTKKRKKFCIRKKWIMMVVDMCVMMTQWSKNFLTNIISRESSDEGSSSESSKSDSDSDDTLNGESDVDVVADY
ncbi:hypothetical protein AKJ16_DCAP21253 [Drosera capensis]